jgi:hypothetical protein
LATSAAVKQVLANFCWRSCRLSECEDCEAGEVEDEEDELLELLPFVSFWTSNGNVGAIVTGANNESSTTKLILGITSLIFIGR